MTQVDLDRCPDTIQLEDRELGPAALIDCERRAGPIGRDNPNGHPGQPGRPIHIRRLELPDGTAVEVRWSRDESNRAMSS
jgi:hypothetical protein